MDVVESFTFACFLEQQNWIYYEKSNKIMFVLLLEKFYKKVIFVCVEFVLVLSMLLSK